MWTALRPAAVAAAALLAILLLDRVVLAVARRPAAGPHRHVMLPCRVPGLLTLGALLLLAAEPAAGLPEAVRGPLRHGLVLLALAAGAWLLARVVALLIDTSLARYATERRDPARIRRVRTQTGMLRRLTSAASRCSPWRRR
ncbi:hypothetical protein ACFQ1I_39145 [Kitasatospora arboriphila]